MGEILQKHLFLMTAKVRDHSNKENHRNYMRNYYQAHKDEERFVAQRRRTATQLNEKLAALKLAATQGDVSAQHQLAQHRESDKLRKRAQRAAKRASVS